MALPNLPAQQTINQYVASGTQTVFNFNYYITQPADLVVYLLLTNGTPILQILNSDYSVTQAGDPTTGGTITFTVAPVSGAIVTIYRDIQADYEFDFANPLTINGANMDSAYQQSILVSQQNNTNFALRGIKYPIFAGVSINSPDATTVPLLGANQIWIGNSNGDNQVTAQTLEENPDVSVLRSQLADETNGADGVGLIGLYDPIDNIGKTLRTKFAAFANPTMGLAQIACQNPVDGATMSLATYLESQAYLPPSLRQGGYFALDSVAANVWLFYQDGTIGNAASGGNRLASATAQRLFIQLWNTCADAQCPVSGGRGANALADFNANKTITLPPTNGRTAVNYAGSYAVGAAFGEAAHTLSIPELPSHDHDYTTNLYVNPGSTGGGSAQGPRAGTTGTTGSGLPHNNLQPSTAELFYIKL